MSEPKRVSALSWQWPLLVVIVLPTLLNWLGYAPQKAFVSFDLIITGGGIFFSGMLLWFVALPKSEAGTGNHPDRTIEWQRALAGPFTLLGALIMGLGGALLVVPDNRNAINITWAVFMLLILAVLGAIMVRALRVFSVRPEVK